jgi:hypothetical protein
MNPTIAHAPMSRAVKVVTITGDVSTFLLLASSCLESPRGQRISFGATS